MSPTFSKLKFGWPRAWVSALSVVTLHLTPAWASPESPAPAPQIYTTKAGDTVERLLKNAMPDSPLNPVLLRKALADANPNVVNGKPGQKFKTGTAITLPEHSTLVRNTLEAFTPPGYEGVSRNTYSANDPASRRNWVRYP